MKIPMRHALITAIMLLSQLGYSAGITVLEVEDGTITIETSSASLIEVAMALNEKSGIVITTTEGQDRLVDIDLFKTPLITAMAKISPNHFMVTKKINGEPVVTEVTFILDTGSTGNDNFNLPTGEPADEIIVEDQMPELEQSQQPMDSNDPALQSPSSNSDDQPLIQPPE